MLQSQEFVPLMSSILHHWIPCFLRRNHTIAESGNLTLQCRVTASNPEQNITWYKATANKTALSYGVHLTFVNISRIDAGKYYRVAQNRFGEAVISGISTVDVQYRPSLDATYPRNHTIQLKVVTSLFNVE